MYSLNADFLSYTKQTPELELLDVPQDTVPRFPVSKTSQQEYSDIKKDLLQQSPADLRDPENVNTFVEYDLLTNSYLLRTKVGEMDVSTPLKLTPEEYQDYSLKQSLHSYFRQKNAEEYAKEGDGSINLTDMQFGIGPAERLFGPGGVRVRTQGSAEITMGLKNNKIQDPSLPERARNRTFFNFDESVQLNMQASVGSKVNFNMNYNTQSSFDFDSKKLKLAYTGEEDEIIKTLEAGNVSMTTSNSLINGGAALFGMKADLQFGKLRVNTLFAQQESESKTVNSRGGVQTKPFEKTIDKYDENRHFFLAHYFYDQYDNAMKTLPFVNTPVNISRVEVWITNKRANFDQARNVVAFTDLAEHDPADIGNDAFVTPTGSSSLPYNDANNLYKTIVNNYPDARNISTVTQAFAGVLTGGTDYEDIESARRLDESEYIVNKQLGYISLKAQLQADEVLAVAYTYMYNGQAYQVGEFSTDNTENTSNCLYVKLLKGTVMSPNLPFWKLMMKNVYSLDAFAVQKEKFRLDILYQSDTTGTYVNYLPEGAIKDTILLRVMNLDRLDARNEARADGFFDFVEGFTVQAETGRIFFPVVEPFGEHLRKKIGNDAIAEKYVFQELYDSTLTVARQIAERNKFLFRGEYKASSGAEIDLGATNVARGSVRVKAGGALLTENVDYIVDYTAGRVTILNEGIISSGTAVSVSLENQGTYGMQRKTMMGLDLNYAFSKDFNFGVTIMHMSEMPQTVKTAWGDESIKNTLWGVNTSYKTESQWLTSIFDKLPLLTLTQPSQIAFNAEFAHLIAGHYENKNTGGYSYLDDFESTQSGFNVQSPYAWNLSSTPYDDSAGALFPEAGPQYVNKIEYGMNRALMAWYYVDGIFTRKNSSQLPPGITKDDQSNHYARAVNVRELYPNKDTGISDASTLPILNVAYYPNERGPYNLDADNINPDGTLMNPEKRWGGIMRKVEQSDFETANIEYIEFWLLDPFIYNTNGKGGDLYFNLGEISEDILKDEKKFFENGLPVDGDTTKVDFTVWGKVPRIQSTVYAFDNTAGAREKQDVGLNGLSTKEEQGYVTYVEYMDKLRSRLSGDAMAKMANDPFSPFNDPAGDNFEYFRSDYYDSVGAKILDRYKRYNGTEGNSRESTGRYDSSAKNVPDVEDINQDNNLNKNERYFEYKVRINPDAMQQVGDNYITEIRTAKVTLANNDTTSVKWYLFKIPIKQYAKSVGGIRDFKTIRFMRMYMTGFRDSTFMRFGSFELVRGEWRTYEQDLSNPAVLATGQGKIEVSSVNIEENGDRKPVNYVLPPGVSRMLDPGQPQLVQQNEQALSLKVTNLEPLDARAVYKSTNYDLRQYKRMQLFTHAEALPMNDTELRDGDMSVFIRLGSDYKNNYYEYEVPLTLTDQGMYNTYSNLDQEKVWPSANMLNFKLEVFTNLKLERNKRKREGQADVSFQKVYSKNDPDNTLNTVSIVGNPSLSEVKTIMIGVRNNKKDVKSAEVWVNELRMTDFNEDGGWAANANLSVQLSDLGSVNMSGRIETAGFGGLDQSLMERRMDDYSQYDISANVQMGKFFPEKAKVSIPVYYAYSKETISPKYNPLDQDIELKDALDAVETQAEKDSIKSFSQDMSTTKSISFNNVKVDIRSKTPMPYDPANFSFGYSYSENNKKNPETEYETTKDYRGNFAYNYTPYVKPFRPFANVKQENGYTRYIKQFALNYLPTNISFQTAMMRNYYEIQLRDLNNLNTGTPNNIPVSFSQNFMWDRAFRLTWNFTSNLTASFSSGTNARIEEPYVQVNKRLNPDQYQLWKDSVTQSIRDLGTPMKYDQQFAVTWNLPLQYIPVLDWVNGSMAYNATYNWDRGANTGSVDMEIGNTIRNQRIVNGNAMFNVVSLYNKNPYLKKVNQKFSDTRAPARQAAARKTPPKFEKEITLNPDSGTVVDHGLFNKKVRVVARGADGRMYGIKYKPLNIGQIRIENKDTATLKLTITPGPKPTESALLGIAEHTTRFLMMVRRFNIDYSMNDGMMLPGFRPEIGDIFGQERMGNLWAPGIGFAFGGVNKSYITDAAERDWLVMSQTNVTPAMISSSKNLTMRATLEPFVGFKIDLTGERRDTRNTEIDFMYEGMPERVGGLYMMSISTIKTAFEGAGTLENGYKSKAFDNFLAYRGILANRLQARYDNSGNYPDNGWMAGTSFAGTEYQQAYGTVSRNSPDVLIPAFLAAYSGKSPDKVALTSFPSLSSLFPYWRVTYDGLIKIPLFKKYFKSFVLNHQYRSIYNIGSFNSYLNWADAGDGLGYIRNVQSGNPVPSSPYEISTVSITEAFNPLFGVNATLLNNVTGTLDIQKSRTLSLNIASFQIVEGLSNGFKIGLGYKMTQFNKVLGMKASQNFSNDLTVRVDFAYDKMQSLIRKIEENITQATSGNIRKTIMFSADYGLSRALTLRAFYDMQINEPLVSSASFPTTNSNYGVSIRFSLAQ